MKRYIERDLAEKAMMDIENNDVELYGGVSIPEGFDGERAVEALRALPEADVQEVVRCKDCKHLNNRDDNILRWCNRLICGCVKDDFFCADGERRKE